jgi:hypothetical protein
MRVCLAAILLSLALPGCMVIKVGVQNPIPGMNTVAIVPFFNLSQEPSQVVDGRRFALAYFAELQKTPGFEVIPIGVVEAAILKNQLDMRNKQDALTLARLLKADAVVIGAVTDYSPYYPQRIGLQVDWYSPEAWLPEMEMAHAPPPRERLPAEFQPPGGPQRAPLLARGQAEEEPASDKSPEQSDLPVVAASDPECLPPLPEGIDPIAQPTEGVGVPPLNGEFDPTQPILSYTRLFDAADADLVNKLRDYLELRGDRRSGGWEAHLHRSEDFIRFASHLMIVEMLSLHGGATKSQIVFKWRKYR